MREFLNDLRYGARMILKRPGTSAIAIDCPRARHRPHDDDVLDRRRGDSARAAVRAGRADHDPAARDGAAARIGDDNVPIHDLVDWRGQQKAFESLAGYYDQRLTLASDCGFPERLRGARMTPNTLSVLRVAPIVGRDFYRGRRRARCAGGRAHRISRVAGALQERSERGRHGHSARRRADDDRRRACRRSSAFRNRTRSGCPPR